MSRRALVTGATGFVGGHLVARLVSDGWEVHALVREPLHRPLLAAGVRTLPYDGTYASARSAVAAAEPDVALHLASLFLSEHVPQDVDSLIAANVLLGTQLLEACAVQSVRGVVSTGTSWQHFDGQGYRPVNLYAATKEAFDAIVAYFADARALAVVTLRLFDSYGPGDRRRKLLALLRDAAQSGTPLAMSPGEQLIDLVYVDDIVEGLVIAAERVLDADGGHEIFGLSSGAPVSLRALVDVVGEVLGRSIEVDWGGRPYRPREVMTPWTPPRALPGWQPGVGLREGLARTFAR